MNEWHKIELFYISLFKCVLRLFSFFLVLLYPFSCLLLACVYERFSDMY
nr:MAG TPA: hypothetical protein [Caudoviricetes sp.]